MNKHLLQILILMLILITASFVWSSDMKDKNGTVGAQFLKISVSARASAMGGAFVALSDDISAIYHNPSGLTRLESFQAMFTMVNLPADIKYQFVAAAMPIQTLKGVVGVYFTNLNSGDMKVTTPMRPLGTGEKFCTSNIAGALTYAVALTNRFSFGLTTKYIGLYSYGFDTHSWAVDIGTLYNTGYRGFHIGARIANFGPDLKYIDETFPMPVMMEIGTVFNILEMDKYKISAALQGARINDSFENYALGIESKILDLIYLRSGYKWQTDSERYSLGAGFIIPVGRRSINVDYSYTDMHYLENYQRFSILINL